MSQPPSHHHPPRGRHQLRAAFDRETRRMGSMATLLNHAVAHHVGMHETDHECLDLLDWTGPVTAGEIGHHLGLSSGAVTALIDRLEASGWVRRTRDPDDRRRVIVHVEPERSVELAPLYASLAAAMDRYCEQLDDHDLAVVVDFLEFANQAIADATAQTRNRARPD